MLESHNFWFSVVLLVTVFQFLYQVWYKNWKNNCHNNCKSHNFWFSVVLLVTVFQFLYQVWYKNWKNNCHNNCKSKFRRRHVLCNLKKKTRESRVEFTFSSKWNHTDVRIWGGMMVSVSRSTKRSQTWRYRCPHTLSRVESILVPGNKKNCLW